MARKFLYLVAIVIGLVIVAAIAFKLDPAPFMRMALVPRTQFETQAPAAQDDYANPVMWIARPDMTGTNPTLWLPRIGDGFAVGAAGEEPSDAAVAADAEAETEGGEPARLPAPEAAPGKAAIFFIHPTSYLSSAHWNAPLADEEANWRALLFVRGMASAFAGAGDVWVPRYRQAAMGAFLTRDVDTANKALDAAYLDVSAAFEQFLIEVGPDRPIILAGHSQGSLHLARLLRQRIAGRPIARRIVAAYVVGWPVSETGDLPRMGLPACEEADSNNCILAWQSFAEPADPEMVLEVYDRTVGFDGQPRRGSRMLCVNPLTGAREGTAQRRANRGTIKVDASFADGAIYPGATGARCDNATQGGRGFLLIGEGPDLGGFVLPGNNYHVFDYPLFWLNVRADVNRRLAAFEAR